MARPITKQQLAARKKAEKFQAKMLKELIKHIPSDWTGMRELAHDAGVSAFTLYSWVEGITVSPRLNTMIKVATAVGYSIELVKPRPALRLVK